MTRSVSPASGGTLLPTALVDFMKRRALEVTGTLLLFSGICLLLALLSYNPSDPSLNSASGHHPANLLGFPGAFTADILLQMIGVVAALPAFTFWTWGIRLMRKDIPSRPGLRVLSLVLSIILACGAIAALAVPGTGLWPPGWAVLPVI